ncbi:MAG: S1 family peptidase [Deltaproteobacteria bacterium]|nr:S1 family peptidase [Deltaproteobacteria bacterium]
MGTRWALLVALIGCSDEVGRSALGITGGFEGADEHAFMMSFRVFGVPNMCSAALIGRRTLVTAAHCVDASMYPGNPTLRFSATNRPDARNAGSGAFIDVVDVRAHPGWGLGGLDNDIALALLASDPGVAPKPWNQDDVALMVGQPARLLGYGYTVPEDYTSWGVQHETASVLHSVESAFMNLRDGAERGICNGDSGGPTYMTFADGTERVVGVHSTAESCFEARDVRLDFHREFIETWLAEKEGPPAAADAGVGPDGSLTDSGARRADGGIASDGGSAADGGVAADGGIPDSGASSSDSGELSCRGCRDGNDCELGEVCVISSSSNCCVPGTRTEPPSPTPSSEEGSDDELRTLRDVDSCAAAKGPSLMTLAVAFLLASRRRRARV